ERGRAWYRRVIDFTAAVGASSTGGHVGAYSIDDWRHPIRRRKLWSELGESLAELAAYAREQGLSSLMAANLAAARGPSTLQMLSWLLSDGGGARARPSSSCSKQTGRRTITGRARRRPTPRASSTPRRSLPRFTGQAQRGPDRKSTRLHSQH